MRADVELADVERGLVVAVRIGVRDDHLRVARAVEHAPRLAVVVVGDLVEHEALPRAEADAQAPPLPADLVPVDGEARALGLGDVDRAHVVAQRHVVRAELPVALRERDGIAVLEVHELAGVHVDEAEHALDRSRVGVAARAGPHVGEHAREAPLALLLRRVVGPGGDGVDVDRRDVGDPRRRSAARNSGARRTAASIRSNSSTVIAGSTPGRSADAVTATSSRSTTSSQVIRRPGWCRRTSTARGCGPGAPRGGSAVVIDTNRTPSCQPSHARTTRVASAISSGRSGSRGWVVDALALMVRVDQRTDQMSSFGPSG